MSKQRNIKLTLEEWITKAKLVHGEDKYDYSKVIYINNKTKVCIICPIHGEFWQNASNHARGYGCPKCKADNVNKRFLSNTSEWTKKAILIHEDKYDYSKTKYIGANKKVIITCPIHGDFEQLAANHLTGYGCPKCGKETLSDKLKLTQKEVITRFKEIHGDKYDYSKVEYVNSWEPITIICPEHGEFKQAPNNHMNGQGCPRCKNQKLGNRVRLTQEEVIKRFKEIHGDKYDYSKVEYVNININIIIICPFHGDFEQKPSSHLQGNGCKSCSNEDRKLTQEEVIKRFKEVHGDKYNYSKVEYVNINEKVEIICKKHGSFWQKPSIHFKGSGCYKCGKNIISQEDFVKKSKLIHSTDKYDYSKVVYINKKTKVCIICPIHREFWQSPEYHLKGSGCPICNESKGEKKIREWLINNNIKFKPQYKFMDCKNPKTNYILRFDFAFFDDSNHLKGLCEYQGNIHYLPHSFTFDQSEETKLKNLEYVQYKDNIKKQYCKNNGIKLIIIPYNMFSSIDIILNKNIK